MPRPTRAKSRIPTFLFAIKFRRIATLIIIGSLILLSVPPAVARSGVSAVAARTSAWADVFPQMLASLNPMFRVNPQSNLPQEQQPRPQTFPIRQPRTRAEREARVRHLELSSLDT